MMMAVIRMTSHLHFVYLIYFALKPHLLSSGLKAAAFSSEQGGGEKVGGGRGIGCSSSYLSPTKSV